MALVMPRTDGPRVHPFFAQITDNDIGSDGRRKRQKSGSLTPHESDKPSTQEETWIDQLNAAATEASKECVALPHLTSISTPKSKSRSKSPAPASASAETLSERAGKTDFTPHDATTTAYDASQYQAPTKKISPPKKMLRVRADGKLSSPKTDLSPKRGRPRKSRQSKDSSVLGESGVVVIKYGKRKKTRRMLGDRINAILSAPQQAADSELPAAIKEPAKPTHPFFTGEVIRSKDAASASKEAEEMSEKSSKPHHPFFTGGVKKPDGYKDTEANLSSCEDVASQRKIPSPRRTRVISRPPGLTDSVDSQASTRFPAFGSELARLARFPGSQHALWPPAGMVHVRAEPASASVPLCPSGRLRKYRKLKDVSIRISSDEEVVGSSRHAIPQEGILQSSSVSHRSFRQPKRHVMTGCELQDKVRKRLHHQMLACPSNTANGVDEPSFDLAATETQAPKSLIKIHEGIGSQRTAFDRFEYESQSWMQKYRPQSAEDVLQQGEEAKVIRDWLKSLTVSSVGLKSHSSEFSKRLKVGRKKRKRKAELDDFIVSTDEDTVELPISGNKLNVGRAGPHRRKQTVIYSQNDNDKSGTNRARHAVVISGPHGCGKSAAVHANARELGFEVFEINAGTRRSGKDILDRIGDMAHNHLVQNDQVGDLDGAETTAEDSRHDEQLQEDLQTGRQSTMGSFFKMTATTKKSQKQAKQKQSEPAAMKTVTREPKIQKQSLILLEEVDVLFEEDRPFWSTVIELIHNTRRPIIMTCTDESLLPLDEMNLFGVFRFEHPPIELAVDYLLLVACSEGHLLQREAVLALYEAKRCDLRATLTELQFFCQMAVGDRKGGLDWMLLDTAPSAERDNPESMRVVSEDTYCSSMGWLGGDAPNDDPPQSIQQQTDDLAFAFNEWDVNLDGLLPDFGAGLPNEQSQEVVLAQLRRMDRVCETFSMSDLLPAREVRRERHAMPDPTQPELPEKYRSHFTEGLPLIEADLLDDQTGTTRSLALAIRAFAASSGESDGSSPLSSTRNPIIQAIRFAPRVSQTIGPTSTQEITSSAFEALSCSSKGSQITSFDVPVSTVAEDIAPYIRSIVSYDLRLEEQRQQLSAASTRPGREGGKMRKTRASRAALEGGNKANTRRERWFPAGTNYDWVLMTGGKDWQNVATQVTVPNAADSMDLDVASQTSTGADSVLDELQR